MVADPKDLGFLAAAMAHDVRNPLNVLALHVNILEGLTRKGGPSKEKLLASLEVMEREIERISDLLDEYLEEVGPEELPLERGDLARLLRQVVEATGGEGGRLELQLEPRLPPVLFDPAQLGRALTALLRHARRQGEVVRVSTSQGAGSVRVSISFGGPPLSQEAQARFFRMSGDTSLAAAKQIVKSHGGSIGLSPKEPGGAAITLSLPTA